MFGVYSRAAYLPEITVFRMWRLQEKFSRWTIVSFQPIITCAVCTPEDIIRCSFIILSSIITWAAYTRERLTYPKLRYFLMLRLEDSLVDGFFFLLFLVQFLRVWRIRQGGVFTRYWGIWNGRSARKYRTCDVYARGATTVFGIWCLKRKCSRLSDELSFSFGQLSRMGGGRISQNVLSDIL